MLLDRREHQVNGDLARFDTVEIDPCDTGHAADRVDHARLEQGVVAREIDSAGGDAPFDDGDLARVEGVDQDLADIRGQRRTDLLHLLADLHPYDVQILAPGEFETEPDLVGAGFRADLLQTGEGGQHLFHRPRDLALDLGRIGVGVGHRNPDERRIYLGQIGQR